jgi:hypothetical protein
MQRFDLAVTARSWRVRRIGWPAAGDLMRTTFNALEAGRTIGKGDCAAGFIRMDERD